MKVAIIQICSVLDYQKNLKTIHELINQAKREDGEISGVFLPEVFYSMAEDHEATPYLIEEGNEHFERIREIATKHKVYLLGGSCATKLGNKVINRSYNFAPSGELIGIYDKMHLFSLDFHGKEKKTIVDETQVYSAGSKAAVIEFEKMKMGVSICFDLRFPELYRHYFQEKANLLSVSSAFTVPTGKAHWETLLRARAIENQAFVIASNQWGKHNQKLTSYGHSMVIDPWGEVLVDLGEGEKYAIVELDLSKIEKVRQRMSIKPQFYI